MCSGDIVFAFCFSMISSIITSCLMAWNMDRVVVPSTINTCAKLCETNGNWVSVNIDSEVFCHCKNGAQFEIKE